MRFMNDWDIERATLRWAGHPVLGPAARQVEILHDWADRNSDGWAYWPKPARAAARLMELIERDGTSQWLHGDRTDATVTELIQALAPVKAFRTRMTTAGMPGFEIVEVPR